MPIAREFGGNRPSGSGGVAAHNQAHRACHGAWKGRTLGFERVDKTMRDASLDKQVLRCTDEVLQEIWRIKDALSAKYGGDLDKFFDDLRERQKQSERAGHRVVDLSAQRKMPTGARQDEG